MNWVFTTARLQNADASCPALASVSEQHHPNQQSDPYDEVARVLFARFDALLAGAAPTPLERELFEDLLNELESPLPEPYQQPLRRTTPTLCHGARVRRRWRPFA